MTAWIDDVFGRLDTAYPTWKAPVVTFMANVGADPFRILVATIISLRTKDEVTGPASERLLAVAPTPEALAKLSEDRIGKLIYPAGFYRTKAKHLRETARILVSTHGGQVPDEIDVLLTLPGVGRKTANLVVAEGYGKPGICVDTHVHRITNRWCYVKTKTPEETETALRRKLPARYWPPINKYLVALGQTICAPISPKCSICPLADLCPKKGVGKSR